MLSHSFLLLIWQSFHSYSELLCGITYSHCSYGLCKLSLDTFHQLLRSCLLLQSQPFFNYFLDLFIKLVQSGKIYSQNYTYAVYNVWPDYLLPNLIYDRHECDLSGLPACLLQISVWLLPLQLQTIKDCCGNIDFYLLSKYWLYICSTIPKCKEQTKHYSIVLDGCRLRGESDCGWTDWYFETPSTQIYSIYLKERLSINTVVHGLSYLPNLAKRRYQKRRLLRGKSSENTSIKMWRCCLLLCKIYGVT